MKKIITTYFFIVFFLFEITCKDFQPGDTKVENPNEAPNTTLANIPTNGATLYALVNLNWDGEDYDGYIDHYEYRYTTEYLVESAGDGDYYFTATDTSGQIITTWWMIDSTMVQPWVATSSTARTVAFNSLSILNHQLFN